MFVIVLVMFIIISGPKGAGKSTVLLQLAAMFKAAGLSVGGVISRGFWKDNERERYDAVDPDSGSSQLLASKKQPPDTDDASVFRWKSWYFLQPAFDEGNRRIGRFIGSYAGGNKAAALFVDEVGDIELAGNGWNIAEIVKRSPSNMTVFMGVRQSILDQLEPVWGISGEICYCK